ncbi:Phosphoglucosamine mutase [Phycisphaerae bacterium RAS1]|nr:Phosphoglucosamine mutase [Phycisphaerae bacterium RAS1]
MALMVGVSGVRGLVGSTLTPSLVLEFAQAYGTLLGGGRVVLARDSRPSGEMFAAAAAAGLAAAGCHVTHLGIVMTPAVGFAIREGKFAGGVSITASHNPAEWNGVKFLDELGVAPDAVRAREIAAIRSQGRLRSVAENFGALTSDPNAGARHASAVLAQVEVNTAPLKGLKVVLDSINGAGCLHTPAFLKTLGCDVIHLNAAPDGRFSHPPEPIRENLGQLCAAVRRHRAAAGFAQDPDADRLAIVDENGTYIGEEYTLALAVESVLSRRRGPVAANFSTSRMIDDIARRYEVNVFRTPTGESHVARAMLAAGCVIGGEGNGGVIDPRVCLVRDSLSAMSLVLQRMAATGKSLSGLAADIPAYAVVKQKFECPPERIQAAVAAVGAAFAGEKLDATDGVRVDFPSAWVQIRGSNTEPILRIIAEAPCEADAQELIRKTRAAAGF